MKSTKPYYNHQQQQQRRALLPALEYPSELPVVAAKQQIAELIANHQVVIIAGETGSGKTTQLPKICLELGRGIHAQIAHTQPRRIAAKSVATRIAQEMKCTLGQEVGYQVRFDDTSSKSGYLKLMTDGILLNQLQQDPLLRQYDTIIIDEAHERSLNIDFLLGILRNLLPKRPDLKLIITSATIDPERFAMYFHNAPMLKVEGRSYPVEVNYLPLLTADDESLELEQGIFNAIIKLRQQGRGDILVFLATEQEIRHVHQQLKKQLSSDYQILPLYGRLSAGQQMRIFQPSGQPRIVLATNIAETSLTVPGIHYAIDAGTARISRYSVRSKVQRLPIEKISKASAEQRKGRCGRIAPGICIRLYEQDDFEQRADYTEPEILRTNLASVILQMKLMRLPEIEQFPFIDQPQATAINDGYKLLYELKAIDNSRELSELGLKMARLPIDPKLAAMLIAAEQFHATHELLILASAMSIQDPRERPHEAQQHADQLHQRFNDPRSDFISLLNLWHYITEIKADNSWNQLRKRCKSEMINFNRVREWREIYAQLKQQLLDLKLIVNKQPADYQQVHQALLSGYISQVAERSPEGDLKGTRNTQLLLFPGSSIKAKQPGELAKYPLADKDIAINNNWFMAAEILETSRTFARTAALIHPEWILEQAKHLVKYQYSEPYWSKKAARAMVKRTTSLYGLVIKANEPISLASFDKELARELFITHALIRQEYKTNNKIIKQNWQNQMDAEQLEERFRRRDILVSEQQIHQHYSAQIKANIHNGRAFEFWFKKLSEERQQALLLTTEQLIKINEQQLSADAFPTEINIQSEKLQVDYKFNPEQADDGVHIDIPLALLPSLTEDNFEWLVPGLVNDKVMALLRALPKPVRRQLVPIPDFASHAQQSMQAEQGSLYSQLADAIRNRIGRPFDSEQLKQLDIKQRYNPTFHVIEPASGNKAKRVLASGKSLLKLQAKLEGTVSSRINQSQSNEIYQGYPKSGFELAKEIKASGIVTRVYPGLEQVDENGFKLTHFSSEQQSEQSTRASLLVLLCDNTRDKLILSTVNELKPFMLSYALFPKQLKVTYLSNVQESNNPMVRDLSIAIADHLIADNARVYNSLTQFELLQKQFRQALLPKVIELLPLLAAIGEQLKLFHKQLKRLSSPGHLKTQQHLTQRVHQLLYQGFISEAGLEQLKQYPRYLKACVFRAEQALLKPDAEQERAALWNKWWQIYVEQEQVDQQLRWLLEEFHVATFAQQLGTKQKVSEKRLLEYTSGN